MDSLATVPGKSALEATRANKARSVPFACLGGKTVNDKYLAKLRAIFAWCVRSDLLPDNPADGVKLDFKKDTKPRRVNFAPSDLTKIFSPERYDSSKPFDETRWAELCALFSGTRASELAQMKLDSIATRRGCLVFVIEEQTKTGSSQRVVPVHSKLIELGLEKRIAELRASGATHLFPEWYAKGEAAIARNVDAGRGADVVFARYIPKAFNRILRLHFGIDRRKVFHSFRHTFKSGLKDAGVEKAMRDDLCGHEDTSAGAVYLHGESIEAKKIAIEKLQYDGFAL